MYEHINSTTMPKITNATSQEEMHIVRDIMVGTSQKCDVTSQLLTKQEAYAVADFIDMNLIEVIRNDTDIDSMLWLRNLLKAYEKLAKFGGYDAGYADEEKYENDR